MVDPVEDDDDLVGEGRPFSLAERKELRRLMSDQARARWFWSSARVWMVWASGAIVGSWAMAEALEKFFRKVIAP